MRARAESPPCPHIGPPAWSVPWSCLYLGCLSVYYPVPCSKTFPRPPSPGMGSMVLGPDLALTMIREASPIPSWMAENPLLLVVGKFLLGGQAVLGQPRVPSLSLSSVTGHSPCTPCHFPALPAGPRLPLTGWQGQDLSAALALLPFWDGPHLLRSPHVVPESSSDRPSSAQVRGPRDPEAHSDTRSLPPCPPLACLYCFLVAACVGCCTSGPPLSRGQPQGLGLAFPSEAGLPGMLPQGRALCLLRTSCLSWPGPCCS